MNASGSATGYTIAGGWCAGAERRDSPNYDERPVGETIDLLVIHAISLPPGQYGGEFIDQFFRNCLAHEAHPYFGEIADLCVSAHFVIDRSGKVRQYVSTEHRAWHCGQSEFCGRSACNDFAIGIELEGCDDDPFEEAQYAALLELVKSLQDAYPAITADRIVGHADIAPGRKTDPGPHFDWSRLRRETG